MVCKKTYLYGWFARGQDTCVHSSHIRKPIKSYYTIMYLLFDHSSFYYTTHTTQFFVKTFRLKDLWLFKAVCSRTFCDIFIVSVAENTKTSFEPKRTYIKHVLFTKTLSILSDQYSFYEHHLYTFCARNFRQLKKHKNIPPNN